MNKKWYALYTKPRNEKKVHTLLQLKGYNTYLPLVLTIKQWSDRKKKVELPLFNSYLFIETELEKFRSDILGTAGVVKFVTIGKEIATLRPVDIKNIQMLLSGTDELEVVDSRSIALQQPVEIIAGPFKGLTGITADYKGSHYFAVEVEAIGASILVNLPASFVKPLS